MSLGDGRDGWTPKLSLEISHGDFTFLPSPAVPDAAPVVPAPQKEPRQGLSLEALAAFEASKRRPSVRRAERCIALAIRKGQAEGRIETRSDAASRAGRIGQGTLERSRDATTFKPAPSDFATHSELYGHDGGAYAMADDVSEEAFEAAIEEPAGQTVLEFTEREP